MFMFKILTLLPLFTNHWQGAIFVSGVFIIIKQQKKNTKDVFRCENLNWTFTAKICNV